MVGPASDPMDSSTKAGSVTVDGITVGRVSAVSCVGLAQTPTSDYWLLLFLRCFQAFGSASTIALGAGVVGDISTRAERGGFFGVSTMGSMVRVAF